MSKEVITVTPLLSHTILLIASYANFCVFKYRLQEYTISNIGATGGKLAVDYDKGEIGELHVYHNTFSPMVSAQLEAFTSSNALIPTDQFSKQCGILGAKRVYDEIVGPSFSRIQLVVKGTKPCLLLLHMNRTKMIKYTVAATEIRPGGWFYKIRSSAIKNWVFQSRLR